MGILVITVVDLECCRCRAKITKVLDCLKEEFCIEKVEFEDKDNRVIVRGKFDAEKLCRRIWCKAGKCIKEIKIVEVWPPKHKDPQPPKHKDPQPPKPECKQLPYPYPLPYPLPWPPQCPPQPPCHCCKPPPPPPPCHCCKPPPPPPPPPPCKCKCPDDDDGHDGCTRPTPCQGLCRPPHPSICWRPWPPPPSGCSWPPPPSGCSWPPPPPGLPLLCQPEDSNSCSIM